MNINNFDEQGRKIYLRIKKHIENYISEIISVRHDLHAHPELAFEEKRTSEIVAGLLEKWGYEVTRGVGKTGVVATLKNGSSRQSIAMRAAMDALKIQEKNDLVAYGSRYEGIMHATGNDGHVAILLATARYLAETKNFDGTVYLIFQPARQNLAGAKAMIDDGLFKRFSCDEIYSLYNYTGKKENTIYICPDEFMAGTDRVKVTIHNGNDRHGTCVKPTDDIINIAANFVTYIQHNLPYLLPGKNDLSDKTRLITKNIIIKNGEDIINAIAELYFIVRTFNKSKQNQYKIILEETCLYMQKLLVSKMEMKYEFICPPVVNSQNETDNIKKLAIALFTPKKVEICQPVISTDDFSHMLSSVRAGCSVFLGTGPSSQTSTPDFNFNDNLILSGAILFSALTEDRLPDKNKP